MRVYHCRCMLLPAAVFLALQAGGAPCRAELTLPDIIENVRRNEELYNDIDVKMFEDYDIGDRSSAKFDDGRSEISHRSGSTHYVTQGTMFRFERQGTSKSGGEMASIDRLRAFDGTTTRIYEQGAFGNIISGRADEPEAIRPHTLFIGNVIHTPLSTYLSGDQAMALHPMGGKKWRDRLTVHSSYEGSGERQGLRCHKVWITTSPRGGSPYDRWELWLAEDRNYLPVEMTSWTFIHSKQLPLSSGRVTELQEIAPGIWFPFDVQVTAYNPASLRESRQMVQWTRHHVCEAATLDPHYDITYFRDLAFPDGTVIYEVKDGQIVHGSVKGAPGASGIAMGTRLWLWVLVVNLVMCVVVAILFAYRRRANRNRVPNKMAQGSAI